MAARLRGYFPHTSDWGKCLQQLWNVISITDIWFILGEIRKENWLLEVGADDDGYAEPMKLQHCKVYVHSKDHVMGG